jgi:hypothetical protein
MTRLPRSLQRKLDLLGLNGQSHGYRRVLAASANLAQMHVNQAIHRDEENNVFRCKREFVARKPLNASATQEVADCHGRSVPARLRREMRTSNFDKK